MGGVGVAIEQTILIGTQDPTLSGDIESCHTNRGAEPDGTSGPIQLDNSHTF